VNIIMLFVFEQGITVLIENRQLYYLKTL
jgi:hypothetical protein